MIQTFSKNCNDKSHNDSNSIIFLTKQKIGILSPQYSFDAFNFSSNLSVVFLYLLFENIQFCFFHNTMTLKYFKGKNLMMSNDPSLFKLLEAIIT